MRVSSPLSMAMCVATLSPVLRYYERLKRRLDTATRAQEQAYGKMSARYFHNFWGDAARAVGAEVEDIGAAFLKIRKGDRWTFVNRHRVMLDTFMSRFIVDNKPLIHRILAEFGWQPPRHLVYDYRAVDSARRFMDDLGKSVVVKPKAASRGDGVTTNVDNFQQLARAFAWAASYGSSLIVEEHVEGDLYRLLFLDGDLIAAVRRDPPTVIGDGTRNIRELVQHENEVRLDAPPFTSLIPLLIDLECIFTLRRQGLSLSSVPAMHEPVLLKSVINQNASKENHTVREEIHPSFPELGRRFGSVLNLKLFGLDLITKDIEAPLNESGGVLIELNVDPGLHYHDLVSDERGKVPVGERVLDAIFTRTPERHRCGWLG